MEIFLTIPLYIGLYVLSESTRALDFCKENGFCRGGTDRWSAPVVGVMIVLRRECLFYSESKQMTVDPCPNVGEDLHLSWPVGSRYRSSSLTALKVPEGRNLTDGMTILEGQLLTGDSNCFGDGIHVMPIRGNLPISPVFPTIPIEWGPKEALVQDIPDYLMNQLKTSESPVKRRKRTVIGCAVQTVPFVGTGGAVCNLGGVEDALRQKIDQRHEETMEQISQLRAQTAQELAKGGNLIAELQNDMTAVTESERDFANRLHNYSDTFDRTVTSITEAINNLESDELGTANKVAYVSGLVIKYAVLGSIDRVRDDLSLMTKIHNGSCSFNWLDNRPIHDTPVKVLTNYVALKAVETQGLLQALHDKSNALMKYLSAVGNMSGDSLTFDKETGKMITSLSNNTFDGMAKLNDVIQEDSDDIADAIGHRKVDRHLLIPDLVVGVLLLALTWAMVVVEMKTGGRISYKVFVALAFIALGVFHIIVGIMKAVSYLSWLF